MHSKLAMHALLWAVASGTGRSIVNLLFLQHLQHAHDAHSWAVVDVQSRPGFLMCVTAVSKRMRGSA
jgi:hypothetical protein